MDQTTGAQRPGLPFLSRTNRLRAEGGGLARRPERCNPGYRPGGERSGAAAKLCPLNDGGENHPGAAPGTSTDASAASVGPHLFLGRPEARIPGLGSDQRRGRSAPPVLLASFLRSKTSDAQGRGTPPSLCISVLTNQVREERKNRCIRMGGSDLRSWSVTTGSTRAHYRRLRRLDASC